MYSKTCVREPPSRLTLNSGWCGKSCLFYKGTCHVILLAKLHDMYLYKTITFPHQPLKSISKVAVLHRFYCIHYNGPRQAKICLRTCAECTDSDSPRACAKTHPGICFPLIHSVVSNDSVSGQQDPDQTAQMSRLIWAFAVRICQKTRFRMARHILIQSLTDVVQLHLHRPTRKNATYIICLVAKHPRNWHTLLQVRCASGLANLLMLKIRRHEILQTR